jgi:uncharacterized membrane protein YeaQ/YmgE (transglycosylase-associated protein family)
MYAKRFLNNIGEIKSKDTNTIITDSTKGVMIGASVGAVIGLTIGFGRKKNLIMSAFIGSIIGGAISRVFVKK